ncbi:nose resistant to fluoxetine protein 6-like [Schistocerca americana]|uniref:nose resistant to fluoxetine protein 6-like n=1 Tax=Schistocerca americana TaxID=7009 RepID=UPI001F5013B6|nr:nose resistant to fluoxetine protein 6-like [Schistocerca americana]
MARAAGSPLMASLSPAPAPTPAGPGSAGGPAVAMLPPLVPLLLALALPLLAASPPNASSSWWSDAAPTLPACPSRRCPHGGPSPLPATVQSCAPSSRLPAKLGRCARRPWQVRRGSVGRRRSRQRSILRTAAPRAPRSSPLAPSSTLHNAAGRDSPHRHHLLHPHHPAHLALDSLLQPHVDCEEAGGTDYALAQQLLGLVPPFAVTSPRSNNSRCLQDSRRFLAALQRLELWAVRVYDASAKLPSGVLNGNVNQYGDFDACVRRARAQYCLAMVQLDAGHDASPALRRMLRLTRSLDVFRSTFDDPGHRVPRFSSINWGVCVPRSCGAEDVQLSLEDALDSHTARTGVSTRVRVNPQMCYVQQSWLPPASFLIVGSLFVVIIGIAVTATLYDKTDKKEDKFHSQKMELLECFSLKKNVRKLISMERSADDIESVHGIRAINAYMLLLSHKSMALFFNPYMNRTDMAEQVGEIWTTLARGASLYTEPFVMLSGLLTSYSFTKEFNRNKKLDLQKEYASRLFRLVPNLATIILFCTFLLPWMGSGPQWNLVVRHHSDICKKNWWRNLLFIHNYFGFENMCLTHTHHVGIDTQLFAISPLLVYLLWKWPRKGSLILILLAAISTFLRFYVTYTRRLTHFVFYGISVSKLFETADFSYILPSHRLTVYIMGIFVGYFLRIYGRNFKLKKAYIGIGWMLVSVLFYLSFVMPATMGQESYKYDPLDAANYAAFAPIGWCLCFMWIIFVSYVNQGGIMGSILSWKVFLISTRISYAVYLTQFPIFFYNVGTTRHTDQYSIRLLFNAAETAAIVLASVALTLFIDLPFQNIRNVLLKKKKS